MTTFPQKYRQIYQCTGGFDDIKCSGAISFPYVDSQLVPKYLKESETDKILFLNIFYLKQFILRHCAVRQYWGKGRGGKTNRGNASILRV